MATFSYTALDAQGRQKQGIMDGDSAKHVRHLLRNQNLTPLTIVLAVEKEGKKRSRIKTFASNKLKVKELSVITRQIATLLTAGMPLAESLQTVAEQSEKPNVKKIVSSIRSSILEGLSLAVGMENFPAAFPPIYRETIAAGEQSGKLEKVLERLADFTEKQYYAKQKIKQALIYPSLMTIVAVIILSFLLTYVVPRMVSVFSETGQQLPAVTILLLFISGLVKNYGIYVLIFIGAAIFGFKKLLLKSNDFRYAFHKFLLKIPVIGNAIKVINTARFARSFGILSAATVPILEAMRASNKLVTILPINYAIEEAIVKVREGLNISRSLQVTKYFPPMSINLIASGEASGQLEAMLERAADTQDQDVAMLIDNALTLFEPALIIMMGAIVLFIVLAILLPIFTLDQFTGGG